MKRLLAALLLACAFSAQAQQQAAFGDSHTYGVGATLPAYAWRAVLATAWATSITNSGVSGAMAIDGTASVFSTAGAAGDRFMLMYGTNDERIYGTSATKRGYFAAALGAHAAWLGAASRMTGQAVGITYSAGWTNIPIYGGSQAKRSDQNGATASFSTTGDAFYLLTIGQDVATGTFSVTTDGVNRGSFTTAATGINTYLGASYGAQMIRISGLGAGSHSTVVTVTSATGGVNAVYIAGVATPGSGAKVYVSNVIRQTAAGYAANGGSDANVTAYNADIATLVSQLAGDGMNVVLIDNCSVIDTATMLADGVHMNDLGHQTVVFNRTMKTGWQ